MGRVSYFTIGIFFTLIAASLAITSYSLYTQSIRLDESQSLWVATKSVPALLSFVASDVHVPLYLLLLHFWVSLFGNSIAVARTLSLLFYLLTLPVLYKLAYESSNKAAAMLTVTIFSLSPFIMWYTSEARMYTLFAFMTCLNHLFYLRLARSKGERGKMGYFISTALGLYTHYFFIFLLVTQNLLLVGQLILQVLSKDKSSEHSVKKRDQFRLSMRVISLQLVAALPFLPWVLYAYFLGSAVNTQPLIAQPTSFNILQALVSFLFGFQSASIQAILVALWPLAIILFFFIFTIKRQIDVESIEYFVMATFVPILLVFAVSFVRPIFLSRYLILVTPTLFFIVAWILLNASKKISSYIVVGFITLSFGLLLYQNVSAATPVKENYEGATTYLEQKATERDIIAVTAPFTVYPIEYTYTGRARITTIPEWNRYVKGGIPPFSPEKLIEMTEQFKLQYNIIYIVFSYDQGYEDDILNYYEYNYQRVAKEQFSPGLELRAYKLRY